MTSLSGVVMLCGYTARSAAYLQGLAHARLKPQMVLLYGEASALPQSQRSLAVTDLPWFCPDLSINIEQTIQQAGWEFIKVNDRALDSDALKHALAELAPELLVYSGYGGQLVPESLLNMATVLHVHSGMLPQYRGSTTLYHEVLEHAGCAASAILLTPTIDTGPLVATRAYPMPPADMDVDYLYDNLIRADLLVEVLRHYQHDGQLPLPMPQPSLMPAYFIIHPLLKHLALKRVDSQKEAL